MNSLLQIAIVLHGCVKVRHSPLKYVFDDPFDDDVLIDCKLQVVVISHRFQDDMVLELLFLVFLPRINANLSIHSSGLSLSEACPFP